jgi:TolB protein
MKKFYITFFSILFFTQASFALVKIDITRGNFEPLPTAISKFYIEDPSKFSGTEKIKTRRKNIRDNF